MYNFILKNKRGIFLIEVWLLIQNTFVSENSADVHDEQERWIATKRDSVEQYAFLILREKLGVD